MEDYISYKEIIKGIPETIKVPKEFEPIIEWSHNEWLCEDNLKGMIGGYFEFFADRNQTTIKNWSGNDEIKDRFGVFGHMSNGDPVGFWINEKNEQVIVWLDADNGCKVLASNFLDFVRLIAIGYTDLYYNDLTSTIEEWNEKEKSGDDFGPWDDENDMGYDEIEEFGYEKLYGVNPKFQKWLCEKFNTTIPLKGTEITSLDDKSIELWMKDKIKY